MLKSQLRLDWEHLPCTPSKGPLLEGSQMKWSYADKYSLCLRMRFRKISKIQKINKVQTVYVFSGFLQELPNCVVSICPERLCLNTIPIVHVLSPRFNSNKKIVQKLYRQYKLSLHLVDMQMMMAFAFCIFVISSFLIKPPFSSSPSNQTLQSSSLAKSFLT